MVQEPTQKPSDSPLPSSAAILLLSMGGPDHLDAVEEYLFQLFSDPNVVSLPVGRRVQSLLARIMARSRAPIARERYRKIGGRSPIRDEIAAIAGKLQTRLNLPVEYALQFSLPSVRETVDKLIRSNINRLVLLPLNPQYSEPATGSALADFHKNSRFTGQVIRMTHHCDHPDYLTAATVQLNEVLQKLNPDEPAHILFAAHSIPARYTRKGDPYQGQIEQTVSAIAGNLLTRYHWSLAYQSRLGPVKWIGPSLEEKLEEIRRDHIRQLVVFPVSFSLENLETYYDLDIVFAQMCKRAGISCFKRVPVIGKSNLYIEALATMSLTALEDSTP